MKSLRLSRILTKYKASGLFTDSLLSAILMSGLALLSITVFDARPSETAIVAILTSIAMTCALQASREESDWNEKDR